MWINIGPLPWNCYENGPAGRQEGDMDDDVSCKIRHRLESSGLIYSHPQMPEFSNDEVLCLLEYFGFMVELQNPNIGRAGFVSNLRSMLQTCIAYHTGLLEREYENEFVMLAALSCEDG